MVASVAFSVILLSGLAVYAAAQGNVALYSASDAETTLYSSYQVLSAAAGFDLLVALQGAVSSHVLGCGTARAALSHEASSLSDSQSGGGVSLRASVAVVSGATAEDNMTGLKGYDGGVAGYLDVAMTFTGSGSEGADVSFDRSEVHYAHLPVRIYSAVKDCMDAAAAITKAIAGSPGLPCAPSSVGAAVEGAMRGPSEQASADGFALTVSYGVVRTGSCSATFSVYLEQEGIPGPAGNFTARLAEAGGAPLGT